MRVASDEESQVRKETVGKIHLREKTTKISDRFSGQQVLARGVEGVTVTKRRRKKKRMLKKR